LQRARDVQRVSQAQDVACWWQQRSPEWESQAVTGVLPSPESDASKVFLENALRTFADILKERVVCPSRRQRWRLVPAPAEPPEDLVIEVRQELVLEKTLRIVDPPLHQVGLRTQIDP
jgi:hypothetical protein